jgi:hypothetical protein
VAPAVQVDGRVSVARVLALVVRVLVVLVQALASRRRLREKLRVHRVVRALVKVAAVSSIPRPKKAR